MLLLDGYTRNVRLHELNQEFCVFYRPATLPERQYFRHATEVLNENAGRKLTHDWIASHIVYTDIPGAARCGRADMSASVCRLDGEYPGMFDTLFHAIQGTVADSSGERWVDIEKDWARNLYDGVLLERTNPKLARRSCVDCKKYWYLESTGNIKIVNSTGEKELRCGPTMCETAAGCAKGTPENQKSLNRANRWAWKLHMECKAIGRFPDDAIVRRNAAIIERAMIAKVVKSV